MDSRELFTDCWSQESAALRELREETNLTVPITYLTTVGDATRDLQGFTVACVYYAKLAAVPVGVKAGDDAKDFQWFDLNDLPEMAFDHWTVLKKK